MADIGSDRVDTQGQRGEVFGPVAEKIAIEPTVSNSTRSNDALRIW